MDLTVGKGVHGMSFREERKGVDDAIVLIKIFFKKSKFHFSFTLKEFFDSTVIEHWKFCCIYNETVLVRLCYCICTYLNVLLCWDGYTKNTRYLDQCYVTQWHLKLLVVILSLWVKMYSTEFKRNWNFKQGTFISENNAFWLWYRNWGLRIM